MTTTELTTIENLDFAQIAALTGARVAGTNLPQLKVNRDPDFPMGNYMVEQNNDKVFAKIAIFRPFINAYQYNEYSPSDKKYTNRSLIIRSFGEEALDEQGGLACGKVPYKRVAELSAEEQARQKNIKCRRLLYGLVTLPETEVLELPVLWRLSGGSFMAPDNALKAITKMKHQFFQHNFVLSTQRGKKVGDNIFYDLIINPDFKNTLELSEDNMSTLKLFIETIERENRFVAAAWRKSKENAVDTLAGLAFNDDISDL